MKQPIRKEKEIPKETERRGESEAQVAPVQDVIEEDPRQSKGKDKVPDPIPKEAPSKNKGPQFEGQTSSERIMKEVILAQFSQLQLTVGKLVDAEKVGAELEVQKRAVADKQRGIAILHKQVGDPEAKCKKLEEDLAKMDKVWRLERLQLQVVETATKREKVALQKELDELLEKRNFQETEAQKLVRGLEEQLLQSQNQTDEAKAKVAELEAELVKANHMVNISNLDNGMVEMKKLLEVQQKLHKAKDDQIAKLENQVRILGADNEDLTPQLNQDQYYDASEEDDDVTKMQAPTLATQNIVSSESVQELVVPVSRAAGLV